MNTRQFLSLIPLYFLAACGGTESYEPINLSFLEIETSNFIADPNNVVDPSDLGSPSDTTTRFFTIKDQATFANWWAKHRLIGETNPSQPVAVDFSKQTVAAISLGFRRNGGFSVRVTGVVEYLGKVEVRYQEVTPSPGSTTTQAAVYPFTMIVIDKPNADVVYIGEVIVL